MNLVQSPKNGYGMNLDAIALGSISLGLADSIPSPCTRSTGVLHLNQKPAVKWAGKGVLPSFAGIARCVHHRAALRCGANLLGSVLGVPFAVQKTLSVITAKAQRTPRIF
jgi:hypothetical protein